MKFIFIASLVALAINPFGTPSVSAKTDWQVVQTLKLNTEPVDILMAANNRWIYILDDLGQINIYETNGRLKDTIDVGRDIDQIKAGPREDLLFLLSRTTGTIKLVSVSVFEEIDIRDAPVKGPVDAPVTIAVFSDFQ